MARPTITVITVTLNSAAVLPNLIESLLAQDDSDFDWVVIDGGSTDNTLELARRFPGARATIISEKDFGIYDALNKGVALARGDYYLVLGSDDQLYPQSISRFRALVSETQWDLVAAAVETPSKVLRPMRGRRWLRGGNAFVASHAVGTLIRRELHSQYGYYSNRYVNGADMHFVLSAIQANARICAADFIAGRFCDTGVSTVDRICSISDAFRIQLAFGENKSLQLALYIYRLLRTLYSWRR